MQIQAQQPCPTLVARSHEMGDEIYWIGKFGAEYTAIVERGKVHDASHFESLGDAIEWVQK